MRSRNTQSSCIEVGEVVSGGSDIRAGNISPGAPIGAEILAIGATTRRRRQRNRRLALPSRRGSLPAQRKRRLRADHDGGQRGQQHTKR